MAAPAEKTTKNLTGKWVMNKQLSDNPEPGLALQGIGYLTRKAIGLASVSLDVNQYEAPPKPPNTSTDIYTHIDIEQTAAGLSSTHERRCIDGEWRDHSDWLFGDVRGKTVWTSVDELEDEFLKQGWDLGTDNSSNDKVLILSNVESKNNGWKAAQVWGFQVVGDGRRYTRAIVITKGQERVPIHLYYDYQGGS